VSQVERKSGDKRDHRLFIKISACVISDKIQVQC
jgi:hypothetical protein